MKNVLSKLLPVFSIVLLAMGLAALLWSLTPPPSYTIQLPLQNIQLSAADDTVSAALMTAYQLELTVPEFLKQNGKAPLRFALNPSGLPVTLQPQDQDLYRHFNVMIEMRPEFYDLAVDPAGTIITALVDKGSINGQWQLRAQRGGEHNGLLWVYLVFYPLAENDEVQRTAILVREMQWESTNLAGLTTQSALIFASAALTTAFFLGFPTLHSLISRKKQLNRSKHV